MNDRTPNGLILPDVATLGELFATQRELPVVMPAVPGGVRFEARSCSALFVTDPAHQVAAIARLARCEVAGSVEVTGDLLGKVRRVVASTNETILVPAG